MSFVGKILPLLNSLSHHCVNPFLMDKNDRHDRFQVNFQVNISNSISDEVILD